jgi:hypothetical protein
MYVLRNRSGVRLSYWIGKADGAAVKSVLHGEDSPLLVEPELQTVSLPETSQTIQARTICVQFEGAWAPLTCVIIDKVCLQPISFMSLVDHFLLFTWMHLPLNQE